uniref:Uncharacterized protein n=1 Tax=Heterorhabditis bacteriophora TaxID=37862 RepID=A0A1I7X9M0_HETBA
MDSIREPMAFGAVAGPRRSPKHFPDVKMLHKEVMVTERSTARKSTNCTKNCNVYVQHWAIEKDKFFSMTMPDHMSHKRLCRN